MAGTAYLDCAEQCACLPVNQEDCNDERYHVSIDYEDEDTCKVGGYLILLCLLRMMYHNTY